MDSPQRAINGTVREWLERSAGPLPGDGWLHRGMLKNKDLVSQQERATEIAGKLLDGADLDVVPWLGPAIADGWFLLRYQGQGEERYDAEKLLRAMIEASGDPDAWQALGLLRPDSTRNAGRFPMSSPPGPPGYTEGSSRPRRSDRATRASRRTRASAAIRCSCGSSSPSDSWAFRR